MEILETREIFGKEFNIYGTLEDPMFLAKDVAEWIDYAWTNDKKTARQVGKMLQTVEENEKIKAILSGNIITPQVKHGGLRENTEMWFLTEDGLYEVLMQSRKPIAKQFKSEVKRILKEIRLQGYYISKEITENQIKNLQEDVRVLTERLNKAGELVTDICGKWKPLEDIKLEGDVIISVSDQWDIINSLWIIGDGSVKPTAKDKIGFNSKGILLISERGIKAMKRNWISRKKRINEKATEETLPF